MSQEISYRLCCASQGEKAINYEFLREFTKGEFDYHLAQIETLSKLEIEDRLFTLVTLNYQDLTQKIESYRLRIGEGERFDFVIPYIDLNRMVLNLLSSIRTYLDHTETILKRKYGAPSLEYKQFQEMTSRGFDDSFAYRFLTKLRNYAQHCGLPSGSIQHNHSEEGHFLSLLLERDSLLANFNSWGATVKEDLLRQPERIDLLPLIDEKVSLLQEIHDRCINEEYGKLKIDAIELLSLIAEVSELGTGAAILVQAAYDIDLSKYTQLTTYEFPLEAISRASGIEITILPPHIKTLNFNSSNTQH